MDWLSQILGLSYVPGVQAPLPSIPAPPGVLSMIPSAYQGGPGADYPKTPSLTPGADYAKGVSQGQIQNPVAQEELLAEAIGGDPLAEEGNWQATVTPAGAVGPTAGDKLSAALSGLKAPPAPAAQRISTPPPYRPNAIPTTDIGNVLRTLFEAAMAGAKAPVRLAETLPRARR